MIREEHPKLNYVFRLFGTKEEATKNARDTVGDFQYKEVPVAVLSGWVLVSSVRPKESRDAWGSILDKNVILEVEGLYHQQYGE